MINLFKEAIEKDEYLNFAIGKNNYFLLDREYGEHWIYGTWVNNILPFIHEKGEIFAKPFIIKMFETLLNEKELNIETKNDCLLYHLHVYYYLLEEGKILNDSIKTLNLKFNEVFENYIKYLNSTSNSKADAVENAIGLIKSRGGLM